jgi:hypothetical protein
MATVADMDTGVATVADTSVAYTLCPLAVSAVTWVAAFMVVAASMVEVVSTAVVADTAVDVAKR